MARLRRRGQFLCRPKNPLVTRLRRGQAGRLASLRRAVACRSVAFRRKAEKGPISSVLYSAAHGMEALSFLMWWFGELLLACVLYRAWREQLFARYPYFYSYVVCVVVSEVVRVVLYVAFPNAFGLGWWISELLTGLMGFGVTWEIFVQMLGSYDGARRMARFVLRILFLLIVVRAGAAAWGAPSLRILMPTTAEVERDLRIVQALLLLGMLSLIVHYSLPTGRNVRLMLVGYGTYLGCQVMTLDALSRWGKSFYQGWGILSSLEYCVTLLIWCAGMWSYFPNPAPELTLEHDYERVSGQATRAFDRLRDHLIQSWRA